MMGEGAMPGAMGTNRERMRGSWERDPDRGAGSKVGEQGSREGSKGGRGAGSKGGGAGIKGRGEQEATEWS